nr:hypothetical protein Iba_chr14dCG2880 [Ipomoea batatas]
MGDAKSTIDRRHQCAWGSRSLLKMKKFLLTTTSYYCSLIGGLEPESSASTDRLLDQMKGERSVTELESPVEQLRSIVCASPSFPNDPRAVTLVKLKGGRHRSLSSPPDLMIILSSKSVSRPPSSLWTPSS